MTDQEILDIAKALGWNMEHEATNWMLVQFAKVLLDAERQACASMVEPLDESLADEIKERGNTPLYTYPPASKPWVGLTHDEVDSWELPDCPTVFEFSQFIEEKLKEKNT